jgi:hypothetical protein
MPVPILFFPTLKAYKGTHIVPPQLEKVPVLGVIGGSKCERLFCDLAHEAAHGETVSHEECSQLRDGMCGLTNYAYHCLFSDLDDPQWLAIRRSIELASTGGIQ